MAIRRADIQELTLQGAKIWWKPIAHFSGHVLVGTILFLVFGAVSVTLALLVQALEKHAQIPLLTLQILRFVETVILIADMVLYLVYVGTAGLGVLKEMIHYENDIR